MHHRGTHHRAQDAADPDREPDVEPDLAGNTERQGARQGNQNDGRQRRRMCSMPIEAHIDQQRHHDDPATHAESPTNDAGDKPDQDQLPGVDVEAVVHRATLGAHRARGRFYVGGMHYNDKTALIVVDVQNDFADRAGSLYVPDGEKVIPFINDEIRGAVEAGAVVVYTQDWHPAETPHFQEFGGIWPVHCVGGTEGAEFHETLDVAEGAMHIRKGTGGEDGYSAFTVRDPETGEESSTGLLDQLLAAGVEQVSVLGLALDYCVKETALDAVSSGLTTTLLADGTKPVNLQAGDGSRAVAALTEAGVKVS